MGNLDVQLFTNNTTIPASHPSVSVTVPPQYKIVGGGAQVFYTGVGSLLTASYPSIDSTDVYRTWNAAAKDHGQSDPSTIAAYALAIYDPDNVWDVHVVANTSASADHPTASATLPSGCFVSPEGRVRRYIIAAYSNPDPTGLPNSLVFGLPLTIHRGPPGAEPGLYVCFVSQSVVRLSKGLYWREGGLNQNEREDWDRFWHPIEHSLEANETAERLGTRERSEVRQSERDRRTVEGISYRDSLCALVTWWAKSKEKLQDAICQ